MDARETQWQQAESESVSMGTQQDLEAIFLELDREEMEAFEAELKQMGHKDDGIWSMGITCFDPTNRPWGHPPDDDESGAGTAGSLVRNAKNNFQIYMMQRVGGVPHPHLPQDTHSLWARNTQWRNSIGKP